MLRGIMNICRKFSFGFFTSFYVAPPAVCSSFQFFIALVMKFSSCFDIFNVFKHSLINFCGLMLNNFLHSINVITISFFSSLPSLKCVNPYKMEHLFLKFFSTIISILLVIAHGFQMSNSLLFLFVYLGSSIF